jgi:Flp pilus assembly protein TadB
MAEIWVAVAVALLLAAAVAWRRHRIRAAAIDRLEGAGVGPTASGDDEAERPPPRPLLVRRRFVPYAVGAATMLVTHALLPVDWLFAATFAAIVGSVSWLVEQFLAVRRVSLVETQLADAIDLIVSSLRAGAGMMQALESAARESRAPLVDQLDDLVGRIRFGDDPAMVLNELSEKFPLETFRLFTFALAVHWEVGGSLAPTLATVGRSIRDRIELGRRIRAQSMEAQVSVVGVLAISYAIALVMWKTNPERMEQFIASSLGGSLVAATMLLQTVGIVWMTHISRIRY